MAREAISPDFVLALPTTTSSVLKDSIGAVQSSLKVDDKKRGKWTRSERIGSLTLEEAERVAAQLTCKSEDLKLYRWCDIRDDWRKCEWMSANDVVLRGTLCLLCYENIPQPAFISHMRSEHPVEDNDVAEITKRLSEVRLSRFQTLGVVTKEHIIHEFSDISFSLLETFLADCGFIVHELKNVDPIETISKNRRRRLSRPGARQLDEDIYAEDDIKGISSQDAQDIAEILCSNGGCSKNVFFSSSFTASNASGIRRHYHRVYCPICQVVVDDFKLRQHMKSLFHVTLSPIEENSYEIIRRLTDVRLWKFFAANPVPQWKVDDLCNGNADLINNFSDFLVHRGFVINPDLPATVNLTSAMEYSDVDDASDDSASTFSSCSSSSSSTASGSSADSFMTYPIMNCIRYDFKILETLQKLENKLIIDDGALDQFEFLFVLGYTMYSLVVSNGCKLTVLSNLREGDISRTMDVKDSGLRMLHFSSKGTSTSGRKSNFLVLDDQVQRVLKVFVHAKQRRAAVLRCSSVTHPENLFFVSYNLKGLRNNDVDYPITKFLSMCGIKWKFLTTHLINSSQDMVAKDFRNSTGEQSLNYYRKLHERCEEVSRSDNPLNSHTIENIWVNVGCKKRKDKGSVKGPSRGYSKNSILYNDRDRVKFPSVKSINKLTQESGCETNTNENTINMEENTTRQIWTEDRSDPYPLHLSNSEDYSHIDNL